MAKPKYEVSVTFVLFTFAAVILEFCFIVVALVTQPDPCSGSSCPPEATCVPYGNQHFCVCPDGFIGNGCTRRGVTLYPGMLSRPVTINTLTLTPGVTDSFNVIAVTMGIASGVASPPVPLNQDAPTYLLSAAKPTSYNVTIKNPDYDALYYYAGGNWGHVDCDGTTCSLPVSAQTVFLALGTPE